MSMSNIHVALVCGWRNPTDRQTRNGEKSKKVKTSQKSQCWFDQPRTGPPMWPEWSTGRKGASRLLLLCSCSCLAITDQAYGSFPSLIACNTGRLINELFSVGRFLLAAPVTTKTEQTDSDKTRKSACRCAFLVRSKSEWMNEWIWCTGPLLRNTKLKLTEHHLGTSAR